MGLFDFVKKTADQIEDVVGVFNPMAGVGITVVTELIDMCDGEDSEEKRTETSLKFGAYLARLAAEIMEAAADGEINDEELAKIKEQLLDFD